MMCFGSVQVGCKSSVTLCYFLKYSDRWNGIGSSKDLCFIPVSMVKISAARV